MNERTNPGRPWLMLFARTGLFIGFQALIALGFLLAGSSTAWESAANWWPFVVTLTNLVCIALLIRFFRQDGVRYWHIFRIQKETVKSDLLILLVLFIFLGPVSFLPNILLGRLLFDDPQQTLALLIRPLPVWAVYASLIVFPVTQGLAELPTYFAYTMPKLENQGLRRGLAVTLASLFLAFQHAAVPFLLNPPFIIWRGLMFVPFAVLIGIVLSWRFRLLPYLAAVHVLMDFSLAAMLLDVAN